MEDHGESLNSPILPYAGKQLLDGSVSAFFGHKSGINERYIYDLGLSTGEILYRSRGGMGITNEPHIILLHDLMRMPYAESLIQEEFETHFKGEWGARKFYRLRTKVNSELKNPNRRTIAKLYCLLAATGFRHKFDKHGNFKGEYFPHVLDMSLLKIYNKKLINSDFVLVHGKFDSVDKNLLTKKSLLYMNIAFPCSKNIKDDIFEYFDFINDQGLDFLVSSRIFNRGLIDVHTRSWAKKYNTFVHSQFKDDSLFSSADIFISNTF